MYETEQTGNEPCATMRPGVRFPPPPTTNTGSTWPGTATLFRAFSRLFRNRRIHRAQLDRKICVLIPKVLISREVSFADIHAVHQLQGRWR
jgi:hypothetical protein